MPKENLPPVLANLDIELFSLLPTVGSPTTGGSSSSSSVAIVPLESMHAPLTLAQLHDYQAHTRPIDINRTRRVNMGHDINSEVRGIVSTTVAEDGGGQIVVLC